MEHNIRWQSVSLRLVVIVAVTVTLNLVGWCRIELLPLAKNGFTDRLLEPLTLPTHILLCYFVFFSAVWTWREDSSVNLRVICDNMFKISKSSTTFNAVCVVHIVSFLNRESDIIRILSDCQPCKSSFLSFSLYPNQTWTISHTYHTLVFQFLPW